MWKESTWCMAVIGNPLPQNGAGGRMLSQVVLESAQPSVQQARKSG